MQDLTFQTLKNRSINDNIRIYTVLHSLHFLTPWIQIWVFFFSRSICILSFLWLLVFMASSSSRRPSHSISSCVFHNIKEDGVWKPASFHVNDWVTMLPSCKGAHRVKRIKRDQVKHHWKGRILAFKVIANGWYAKVQHVYMTKDMMLNREQHHDLHSHCELLFFAN